MTDDEKGESGPTPPNIGGPQPPSLGTTTLPKLDNTDATPDTPSSIPSLTETDKSNLANKKKKGKINPAEIIRRWKVSQRGAIRSLQVLMSFEFKTNVLLTPINTMYRKHVNTMMEGQISYLRAMINIIKKGDDKLSQELMEIDFNNRASTQVFETLVEIIEEEKKRLEEEKPKIIDIIENDLKRHNDARLEPRACFWIIWSIGMQLNDIFSKEKKAFNIVLEMLLRYPAALRRALGVLFHFAFHLVRELDCYPIDSSQTTMIFGPGGTGYNMAPWIKYRYGTNSQSYMEYERYLEFYARSFGMISGNAPKFENGPKDGYQKWIQRTLNALEKSLRKSPQMMQNTRGNSLEGILVGMMDELKEELDEREYIPSVDPLIDPSDKLINQPIGGEGALIFIEWLFETAINRYNTTNIASHGKIRLSLDMFKFISFYNKISREVEYPVIRWENELSERLVHDWLDPEQE